VETLSDRELEVFRMLGQGKGTRQISRDLNVTVATVNSFRNRIKEKLGLKTSTEVMLHAIQWCREDGPVSLSQIPACRGKINSKDRASRITPFGIQGNARNEKQQSALHLARIS